MDDSAHIEQQIRQALAAETDSVTLSNLLFGPDGLFDQLASTEVQRRLIAQSPLFKRAQRRVSELRRVDATTFTQIVGECTNDHHGSDGFVTMERA